MSPAETYLLKIKPFDEFISKLSIEPFKKQGSVFQELVAAVIYQQISVKAADSIYNRLKECLGKKAFIPDHILHLSEEQLKSCGLSSQKRKYVKNISSYFKAEGIGDETWGKMDDEEIISKLTSIKGVGIWTVQMLLMFYLERPDVFPSKDLAIQVVMKKIFNLEQEKRDLILEIERISEAWKPYRSVASKYLWAWKREN